MIILFTTLENRRSSPVCAANNVFPDPAPPFKTVIGLCNKTAFAFFVPR